MKKTVIFILFLAVFVCPISAKAQESFTDVLPHEIANEETFSFSSAVRSLTEQAGDMARSTLKGGIASAASLTIFVLLCSLAENWCSESGSAVARYVPYIGVLGVCMIAAGDLETLLGVGESAIGEFKTLSQMLLPSIATTIAASGYVGTASAWQVGTMFLTQQLTDLIADVFFPLTNCSIALMAAGAIMPQSKLDVWAESIKKGILIALTAVMLLFSGYLSVSHVIAGAADRGAVKAVRFTVSTAIPLMGNILAEATESVVAGASALRSVIGMMGIFAVLFTALAPLLRLAIQYLLYQASSMLCGLAASASLSKFTAQLGGVFALMFAMTGCCAMLLLVSLLVAVKMVVIV